MKFIDVHCHINEKDYGSVDVLIGRINAVGVEKIISAGFDVQSSEYGKSISGKYDCVYFTAGVHPTELKTYRVGDLEIIKSLADCQKCVAIGEIGLDYHYPDTDKILQRKVFLSQLELAIKLEMPVQIHSRDCAEDMFEILKDYAPSLTAGAMLHSYSHSVELASELEKSGLYFSFGGTSTWSGSKKAKRVIKALSADRLMTETDSPYLPPASKYGAFPNTPESIPEIAENMAEIKGMSLESLADCVWNTAHSFFKKLSN